MPQQGRGAEAGPWEGRAHATVGAGDADDVDVDAFVDVHVRDGLGDQQAARGQDVGHPAQQGGRVAADADIAVDEEPGVPAALTGERLEDGALQRLPAEPHRVRDGGLADIDPERGPPPRRKLGDQPPRPASHVEHGPFAAPQRLQIGRVGPRTPPLYVEREQPPVGTAKVEGASAGTERVGVRVRGPGSSRGRLGREHACRQGWRWRARRHRAGAGTHLQLGPDAGCRAHRWFTARTRASSAANRP
ncbi:hypothetical protein GCM10011579_035900 [Streptomyces albiflavescens]|uniref:Uncharacterized protein n=1 Tax=Streptomyces albiflavescens TaxID=1623582 RepID=A0A917Y3W6_9ACTN|nr:hypothetical protein GCM10011579_035900 [Streptomyces albiflavescens]